jgi:hypothetical protein
MPALADYDVRPALHTWLKKKDKRSRDSKKAVDQEWFSGIFVNL